MKAAFRIEFERQKLAQEKKFEDLKKFYKASLAEIKDLNTPLLWDEIYEDSQGIYYQDPMTKDRIKTAVNFIPKGTLNILDIGAGFGWIEELLDGKVEIYANDFSRKSVNYLKKNFRGHFSLQSFYNLKHPVNFFDVILMLEVLEHIPPSKVFRVLKTAHSLLKEKGVLIVSVPMNEGLEEMKDNPSGHVRMYSEDLIKAELRIAGFKVISQKTFFAFNSFYILKTLIARVFKTHKPNNIILKVVKI